MFYFDFPIQLQTFLNQYWIIINYLLIFLLLFLIYVAYKKPVFGAGAIIIALPAYLFRAEIFGIPTTYLELCLIIFFLALTVRIFTDKRQVKSNPPAMPEKKTGGLKFPLLLFLFAATISIFISGNAVAALGLWKAYFIEPILFFIILIKIVKTPGDKKIILWSLGISALSISLLAIFQKFTGFGIAEPIWVAESTRRVTAIFTSPNAVGLFLAPIFMLYITPHLFKERDSKHQLRVTGYGLRVTILLLIALAIIFTKSQGAWLGILAGIIFLSYFNWSKKWTIVILTVAISAVLIIPAGRQIALPIITFSDQTGQNRIATWNIAWQYLTESPKNFFFGAGIFGFPKIHEQFRNPAQIEPLIYPHNIILNFWLETGLLGLIAISWILFVFFKTGFSSSASSAGGRASYKLAIMAAMIVILIHGLVDVPYFKNDLSILFWIIAGLMFV